MNMSLISRPYILKKEYQDEDAERRACVLKCLKYGCSEALCLHEDNSLII